MSYQNRGWLRSYLIKLSPSPYSHYTALCETSDMQFIEYLNYMYLYSPWYEATIAQLVGFCALLNLAG